MKPPTAFSVSLLSIALLCSCTQKRKAVFPSKVENIAPWCILGFDSLDRTPKQRIDMLKEMGFTKYGFNKGKGHLDEMHEEFKLAKENNIEVTSIFLWLNPERDSIGKLSPYNLQLLEQLKEVDYKPSIWVSFSENFFEELSQEQSVELSIEMIKFIKAKADELGCELALYNHHGWFGNPYNQLEILEAVGPSAPTIVYNFHHAQEHVDEFPEIAKQIRPHLSYVNISGVTKQGPQILTIGEGDHEFEMIQLLLNEGFTGPWGILGHVKNDDVQKVLERNMNGLQKLASQYNAEEGE